MRGAGAGAGALRGLAFAGLVLAAPLLLAGARYAAAEGAAVKVLDVQLQVRSTPSSPVSLSGDGPRGPPPSLPSPSAPQAPPRPQGPGPGGPRKGPKLKTESDCRDLPPRHHRGAGLAGDRPSRSAGGGRSGAPRPRPPRARFPARGPGIAGTEKEVGKDSAQGGRVERRKSTKDGVASVCGVLWWCQRSGGTPGE